MFESKKQSHGQLKLWKMHNMTEVKKKPRLSRRGFLIIAGVVGGGWLLGAKVGLPFARLKVAELFDSGAAPGGLNAEATAWFQITPENKINLFIPKVEMGQGIHTALAQIAAEELEVDWKQLEVVQAGTGQGLDDNFGTGASNSVSTLYQPIRQAAATMRQVLQIEAAQQMAVAPEDLMAQNGSFILESNGQSLSYWEVASRPGEWEIPETPPVLKSSQDFRFIGHSIPRVDLHEKILGKAVFGYDHKLPKMLYGAVARPPKIGAKLISAETGDAVNRPGVVEIVIEDDFVGAVAETREQAYSALNFVDMEWRTTETWEQAQIEALVTVGEGKGIVIQKQGNPERTIGESSFIEAEYRTPMAFHAHFEPQAATADVREDRVDVWAATQFPVRLREFIAEVLGRKEDQVFVTPTYLGGGFGRKIGVEAATEAARLSAAAGRPVHIGWTRPEDFRNGFLRPPTHHVLRGLLQGNRILAMEHQQASGAVAFPFLSALFKAVLGADFGAWRGAMIGYDIPEKGTTAWLSEIPLATGWWRGLGLLANTFALESFIDEMAFAAGTDPVDFRLNHLPNDETGQRRKRVLQTAAEIAGWGKTLPAGRALGIANSIDVGTPVAQVAEVSVEQGKIRVHKVTSVVDPGLVINPDGATAQIQGAIIMGLSSTLLEEATVEDSQLSADNFNRYPILQMKDTPQIEVVLQESGDTPHGMGEPPIGPIAASVANAVFALTGQRLRRLPLRLE
jgi:isoquinoline 1-oxidoreductase beta subunit